MTNSGLPLGEIQGLLASGYGAQPAMCSLLLSIIDPPRAKLWLANTVASLSFCDDKLSTSKMNLALSYSGLQSIAASDILYGFSREFCEGMVTPHRQRILGDLPDSPSDPRQWHWGGPNNDSVDIALMVYETNREALANRLTQLRDGLQGVKILIELHSTSLKDGKEHFGFRDGISQPWMPQLHRRGASRDQVTVGEFVLGHADNTQATELAPAIACNGSYLVMRQLGQRVPEFWESMPGESNGEKIRQASKRVGRWPDGTPVTLSPSAPDSNQSMNDFAYSQEDRDGKRCPIGAHIRRANPRDALLSNPQQSLESINRHRILRRGRTFGSPAPQDAFPDGIVVESEYHADDTGEYRGILFMCLNASIARQFEFVQQNWLNNPKFMNLSNETDPIASGVAWAGPGECPTFTAPNLPLRNRHSENGKPIFTIGGGYFFLPSRSAMLQLATS